MSWLKCVMLVLVYCVDEAPSEVSAASNERGNPLIADPGGFDFQAFETRRREEQLMPAAEEQKTSADLQWPHTKYGDVQLINWSFITDDEESVSSEAVNESTAIIWPQNDYGHMHRAKADESDQRDLIWKNRLAPRTKWATQQGKDVLESELSDPNCPRWWLRLGQSCYKFALSPKRTHAEARKFCQAFRQSVQDHADLASVASYERHRFFETEFKRLNSYKNVWHIGDYAKDPSIEEDEDILRQDLVGESGSDLAYFYSQSDKKWLLKSPAEEEKALYVCEMPAQEVSDYLTSHGRTLGYGQPVMNPKLIPRGPTFVRQPNQTVYSVARSKGPAYKDVSLLCLAKGWPTPTYKWFKNNVRNETLTMEEVDPMQDARITISGGQLIVHSPSPSKDRGSYFCTASNRFGTIRSRSITLAFEFIDEYDLARGGEIGTENWGKAMSCDRPKHFPQVQYYWAKNYFPNFVREDKRVMVSHDGYIYFSALEQSDQGNYSCSVKSAVSSHSRNGPFFPLKLAKHPNYQQLRFPPRFPKTFPEAPVAGEPVRLECVAFGYPVPSYNWTRKGEGLPPDSILTNYNRVLIIPEMRPEHIGEYICHAFNEKVAITASLTLGIRSRPIFTHPLIDLHLDEQDTVVWTCEAFGIPEVTYEWLKNGIPIQELIEFQDQKKYLVLGNMLIIRNVQKEADEGMYQCRAVNELDSSYSSAQLRVLSFPPSFSKDTNQEKAFAALGGNATLHCNPEAAPRPEIAWAKDGAYIEPRGKYSLLPNGDLILRYINNGDAGEYTCEAKNQYGAEKISVQLIVKSGPSFDVAPQTEIVVNRGETLTLPCQAHVDTDLDSGYSWQFNGLKIDAREEQGRAAVSLTSDENKQSVPDSTPDEAGTMKISNITYSHAGMYECSVNTPVGSILGKARVIVQGPPGPPTEITATNISSTSATLFWTDGDDHGSKIDTYRIEGRHSKEDAWKALADHTRCTHLHPKRDAKILGTRMAVITEVLSPHSTYSFRVAAYNKLGLGSFSVPSVTYKTKPGKPTQSPGRVRGGGGNTGDLTVRWDPLPVQEENAPDVHYKIHYRRIGLDEEETFRTMRVPDSAEPGIWVIRVDREKYFYTKHEVKVQVFNSMCQEPTCQGPISEPVMIYSAEDLPDVAPTDIRIEAVNSTCLNVTWKGVSRERDAIRGRLIGHKVKYWRQDQVDGEEHALYALSRSKQSHALVGNLQPNTYYWARVMVYNSAGPGPESSEFLEKTFKRRPQKAPHAVQVIGRDFDSVKVTWRFDDQLQYNEEPIQGFKIRIWEASGYISSANDTVIHGKNRNEVILTDLEPGRKYFLRVLAFSKGGDGTMSSPTWQFQMEGEVRQPVAEESNSSMPIARYDLIFYSILALLTVVRVAGK